MRCNFLLPYLLLLWFITLFTTYTKKKKKKKPRERYYLKNNAKCNEFYIKILIPTDVADANFIGECFNSIFSKF